MEYYKHSPDLGNTDYLFVSNDSIWVADRKSNIARVVVSGMGIINNARFSPDGTKIVFRSMRGKDSSVADLYMYDRGNATIRRITYLNGKSVPRRMFTDIAGWKESTPIISTDAYSPFGALTHLYILNEKNLSLDPMNLGPAAHILFSDDYTIIGRYTYDMPHWKGYKGGTKGVIWSGKNGQKFKKIVDLPGHVSSPCIFDGHIFFVSDHEGWGQIYSIDPDGKNLKKYSNFKDHYPRHLSSNGKTLMYSMAGEIYTFSPQGKTSEKINVEMSSGVRLPQERFPSASDFMEEFLPDTTGESYAVVARGKGFLTSKDLSLQIPIRTEGRVRLVRFLDKNTVAFVKQNIDGERLCVGKLPDMNVTGEAKKSVGLIDSIVPSPDGKRIAFTDINFCLYIAEVDSMDFKKIDTSEAGKIKDVAWSHDGKRLAYTFPYMSGGFGQRDGSVIKIMELSDNKGMELTERTGNDYSPSFDSSDSFLLYLSDRTFDPVDDRATFNYSFPLMTKIYYVNLSGTGESPTDNIPESMRLNDKQESSKFPEVLPVETGNYSQLTAVPGGVMYLSYRPTGLMGVMASGEGRTGRLMHFNFSSRKSSTVARGISEYHISSSGEVVVIKGKKGKLKRIETKIAKGTVSGFEKEEEINIDNLSLKINLHEEWKQMFDEAWLLAFNYFWNKDFSKKNDKKIYKKYRPMVDHITTRFELSEIIREMQGEFSTSHSYETGGDFLQVGVEPIGLLGADLTRGKDGLRIQRIYMGDPSNDREKSPLLSAGFREGDVIVSIQGKSVKDFTGAINSLFLGLNSSKIRIDAITGNGEKHSGYVETLSDDRYLRYRDWVEANRKLVHEKTKGKIGYVHIPNMMLDGLAEFYRLYTREFDREGLLVDVRFNGGGNVSQLILEKLLRERIAFTHPGLGQDSPYPSYSIGGPMVALTNENAGSDGDIFSHSFKLLSLGPLVGTRTWGGVIGINPERKLADGTMVTQPRFGLNFKDVGFGVENYGTDPTHVVEISPDDWKHGKDPQMEKSLELVLEMLTVSKQ